MVKEILSEQPEIAFQGEELKASRLCGIQEAKYLGKREEGHARWNVFIGDSGHFVPFILFYRGYSWAILTCE